jgi:hypothetical protein
LEEISPVEIVPGTGAAACFADEESHVVFEEEEKSTIDVGAVRPSAR